MRMTQLFCAATLAACVLVAACGDGTPTGPSAPAGAALQSLTLVGPSGGVILHRNETATGTVTLSAIAPANAVVTLQTTGAERSVLIVPASVTIPRGSASATFSVMVNSSGVSSPAEVTLSATYAGRTESVIIRLER
jgi:hypothetical protein